ncbi:MAG TPA: hypothetical protein VN894_11930, partial [Polyangiaceae bacterium]|nr:hypothetical protein [Polyangiaceae bacterium]
MPNKNVLAILSGVVAVASGAIAILMHGHPLAVVCATAGGLGLFTWGLPGGSRRNALLVMTIAAGAAALFLHFDNFLGLATCALTCCWAAFSLLPAMDGAWRLKVGFVVAVFLGALVALWPTLYNMTSGKVPLPSYLRDRIAFAIAPGLDLRGGMRLVYTVEVDEAIRDKRDHFADEMRQELATSFGLHSGEGRVTRDELSKLDAKVHVSQPETALIRLNFADAADKSKVDDRFARKFLGELSQSKGPGDSQITFKIRADIESQIRDGAVAQAKDTILRRVDELGLREPSVTTRDEDIIVEVPGTDEKSFQEIKDTIRRTARLEFKMLDDGNSEKILGPPALKADDLPDGEGIAQYQEMDPDGLDAAGHKKAVKAYSARMSCQPPKYPNETMAECLGRFKAWAKTLNVPADH